MVGTGLVAGEVVMDALPYFDQGYEAPGVREAAAALVEEETRRYLPTKYYLSYLTALDYSAFETDIMRNEFERLCVWCLASLHSKLILLCVTLNLSSCC
uniref:Pre-mRNA-splicing factor SPF27 n=1 Tax=Saimiri boliviensis boliviensis TaxID=39432 RepID=A0A2K6SAS2_SAIBB